jgi:hypothetical protein
VTARAIGLAGLLVLGATVAVGCQRAPGPVTRAPAAVTASFEQLQEEADGRLAQGDWAGARTVLEEALRRRPADAHTRYLHAVVLSHLDLRDHAAEGFSWVVANGAPGSDDVEQAQRWLMQAGVLQAPEPAASPEPPESDGPSGRLRGRTRWDVGDNEQVTVDLILEGTGATTAGRTYASKAMLNDEYEFPPLVPGEYRLRALRNGQQLWDTAVVVREGAPTVLDLGTPSQAPATGSR